MDKRVAYLQDHNPCKRNQLGGETRARLNSPRSLFNVTIERKEDCLTRRTFSGDGTFTVSFCSSRMTGRSNHPASSNSLLLLRLSQFCFTLCRLPAIATWRSTAWRRTLGSHFCSSKSCPLWMGLRILLSV